MKHDLNDAAVAVGVECAISEAIAGATPFVLPSTSPTALDSVSASRSLKFRTVAELEADHAVRPSYLWAGIFPFGAVTVVAGHAKHGKSTLLYALLAAAERGDAFCGRRVEQASAVVLTEESPRTVSAKARRFGITKARFLTRSAMFSARGWTSVVAAARAAAAEGHERVLIVDTLLYWAGLPPDAENDSAAMQIAMMPLLEAAESGFCVIVVTHLKKGVTAPGSGIRGSSAIAATADVLIELRPVEKLATHRAIHILSRFDDAPEGDVVVRLESNGFVAVDVSTVAKDCHAESLILEALRASPLRTQQWLKERVACKTQGRDRALQSLLARGAIVRTGTGRRGDPYRYSLPPEGHPVHPPGAGPEASANDSVSPSHPLEGEGETNSSSSDGDSRSRASREAGGGHDPG